MMVRELVASQACSVRAACEATGLSSSSYYYVASNRGSEPLAAELEQEAGWHPTYGSRRLTQQLRRAPYGQRVNRKRVQRLMRERGLLRPVKRSVCHTTQSQHPYPRYPNLVQGLEIAQPEQVWVSDITYIRLGTGFVYLALIMDVFSRNIRAWNLSRRLDTSLTLTALHSALLKRQPRIHHSDQGIHYAAQDYIGLLQQHQVQISMAAVGMPEENGYAERLMRTIKEEEVQLSDYRDFADAQQQIGFFIDHVYATKRIHSALGYLTPAEFEAAWRCQTTP
jgi:putative transposase